MVKTKQSSLEAEALETLQKAKYTAYLDVNKFFINAIVESCARTFRNMKTDELIGRAEVYDSFPLNTAIGSVEALVFELNRRGLEDKVPPLMERLSKVQWYTKPWTRF